MTFVIYHISSTMQVGPSGHGNLFTLYAKTYKTWGGALRVATKANDKEKARCGDNMIGPGPYGVAELSHYQSRVVRKVTRTNLQSGLAYQEDSNTPGFCSPASEAYWSM